MPPPFLFSAGINKTGPKNLFANIRIILSKMKGQKLMQPIVVTYRRHGRNFWALYPKLYWQIFFYRNHLQNIKCFDACQSDISKTATKSMFLFQYINPVRPYALCCFFLTTDIAIRNIAATAVISTATACTLRYQDAEPAAYFTESSL